MASPLPLSTVHNDWLHRLSSLKGRRVQIRMPDNMMLDGILEIVGPDYCEVGNGGNPTIVRYDRILYIQPLNS